MATRVWNRLTNDDSKLAIELRFRHIDDFEPACIAAQVLPLNVLMEMRQQLMQLLSKLEGNGKLEQLLADMLNNTETTGKLAGQIGIEMDAPAADIPEAGDALSLLDQVVAATRPQSSHEQNRAKDYIGAFVRYIIQPGQVVSKDIETNIKTWVCEIDKKLSAQLDEIMHDPSLQMLESSWRGLHHLVSNKETSANVKIKVLNVRKQEIFKDLDRAVEFDQSLLFKKVHDDELGTPGGEPFGVLLGDFEFGRRTEDVSLLKMISSVAAAAFCPFISAASPQFFGFDSWHELPGPRNMERIMKAVEYIAWRSFRESEDSRFVALAVRACWHGRLIGPSLSRRKGSTSSTRKSTRAGAVHTDT